MFYFRLHVNGNFFYKIFLLVFFLYSWWQTDSNWKPFIYHTFMIFTKRLGSNDDSLNIKLRRIPKCHVFMLNVSLKGNEPNPGYLRGEQCHRALENQYMIMWVPQLYQQIQNRSIDRLLIAMWPLCNSVSVTSAWTKCCGSRSLAMSYGYW